MRIQIIYKVGANRRFWTFAGGCSQRRNGVIRESLADPSWDLKIYLRKFQPVLASFFAVVAGLIVACSAGSTPSPPLPTVLPTSAEISTTQAAGASSAPARLPTVSSLTSVGDPVFIQLTDPLDEPEYYCLDVPGAGPGVRLQSALQAHTCKPVATAADELFNIGHPNKGQIYMEAYDLCVEAEEAQKGSALLLKPCSDSDKQLFALENDVIRLRPRDDLCLAVDPGSGIPTGGPSHLRRALTLKSCESTDPTLIKWSIGLFDY